MPLRTVVRIAAGLAVYLVVLGLLRYRPWAAAGAAGSRGGGRPTLAVGFLPVT